MLRKLTNARSSAWEDCLGPVLWANRVSTSSVTGYSPHFLTFGRPPKLPLQKLWQRPEGIDRGIVAARLDELSLAFQEAARRTETSRMYNRERLERQANAGEVNVGDHVMVRAHGRAPLDPHWDHGYVVTRVRGPVLTVVGPRNNRRTVNRRAVRVVDPDAEWDLLRPRQTYAQRTAHNVLGPAPLIVHDQPAVRDGPAERRFSREEERRDQIDPQIDPDLRGDDSEPEDQGGGGVPLPILLTSPPLG